MRPLILHIFSSFIQTRILTPVRGARKRLNVTWTLPYQHPVSSDPHFNSLFEFLGHLHDSLVCHALLQRHRGTIQTGLRRFLGHPCCRHESWTFELHPGDESADFFTVTTGWTPGDERGAGVSAFTCTLQHAHRHPLLSFQNLVR
jgi:hypothetical protein